MGKISFLGCVLAVGFWVGCGQDNTISEASLQNAQKVAAHIWQLEHFVEGRFKRGVVIDTEVTLMFGLEGDVGAVIFKVRL